MLELGKVTYLDSQLPEVSYPKLVSFQKLIRGRHVNRAMTRVEQRELFPGHQKRERRHRNQEMNLLINVRKINGNTSGTY